MMLRLLKKLFSADTLGAILIVSALQTVTYGVSSSLPGTETSYLFIVCLIAALIAFRLSQSRFGEMEAAAVIGTLGIVGIWLVGARLMYPLLDLGKSILTLIPQIFPALHDKIPIDARPVIDATTIIVQASIALTTRWKNWFIGIQNGITVNDALIRNMIWTFIMWSIAAWTGWFTSRHKANLALLPQLFLLTAVISYSEHQVVTVWMLVCIQLLLLGIWNYKDHTTHWDRSKIDYSDSILYDNTQAVFMLAAVISIMAFLTPSISWQSLRDYFNRQNENRAAEILGIQEQKVPSKNTSAPKPSLPREHLLTQGFEQSQRTVMTIRTGELPPMPASARTVDAPRYYWRSTIYDKYMGDGWVSAGSVSQNYNANTPLIQGLLDGYRLLHLDVDMHEPQGKLFWSGILYSADVSFRVDWRAKPQSNLFADQTALLQADAFDAPTNATSYTAQAYVPVVSVEKLRTATVEYPQEIRDRYLQIPDSVPQRVRQLAIQITTGIENPYDKAKAIESYLRTNYEYDLKILPPPVDQDVADYFLFDLKKGYCDYYATAMVVLARLNGLPARFVSGYSSGFYDSSNAEYVIRELNAHSWPEIYFPKVGWIEFEPTAAQPEIKLPEKETVASTAKKPTTLLQRFLFQITSTQLMYWLSPFGFALLLIVLYYAIFERLIFVSLAPGKAIEFMYRQYYRLGRTLAGPRGYAETAHEFTGKLIDYLEHWNRDPKPQNTERLKIFKREMKQFTDLYSSILFSNHPMGRRESSEAFKIWRHLRMLLLMERIKISLFKGNKVKRISYTSV